MEDLNLIFNDLKKILLKHKGVLVSKSDTDKSFDLYSMKKAIFYNKMRNEIYFAAITIQSKYVGFYFMPVYTETEAKDVFKPELLRLLKGKSCFHIKKPDKQIYDQIDHALSVGYKLYQEKGWI